MPTTYNYQQSTTYEKTILHITDQSTFSSAKLDTQTMSGLRICQSSFGKAIGNQYPEKRKTDFRCERDVVAIRRSWS